MKFNLERTRNVLRVKLELFYDKKQFESEINLKLGEQLELDSSGELYGMGDQYDKCVDLVIAVTEDIESLAKHLHELEQEENRIDALPYCER